MFLLGKNQRNSTGACLKFALLDRGLNLRGEKYLGPCEGPWETVFFLHDKHVWSINFFNFGVSQDLYVLFW